MIDAQIAIVEANGVLMECGKVEAAFVAFHPFHTLSFPWPVFDWLRCLSFRFAPSAVEVAENALPRLGRGRARLK